MLTKDDLKQIKNIVQDTIQPLGREIDNLEGKVDDLILETKAIHEIIETQSKEHEQRIERLEEHAGIN